MGTVWILMGFVIVCAWYFRQHIIGLFISPREAGIYYLSDLLLKQHGYPHGTVPRAALGALIDMQLEIAQHSVGSGIDSSQSLFDGAIAKPRDADRRMDRRRSAG